MAGEMFADEFVGESVARALIGSMTPVCRTAGCPASRLDELGYCEACRARYDARKAEVARLGDCARQRYWRLFAGLSEEQAHALAGHAAGNALIGQPALACAIGDFLAEARELAARTIASTYPPERERPRLRVIIGGRR